MQTLQQISERVDKSGKLYHRIRGAIVRIAADFYADPGITNKISAKKYAWSRDVMKGNIKQRADEIYRLAVADGRIHDGSDWASDEKVMGFVSHLLDIFTSEE